MCSNNSEDRRQKARSVRTYMPACLQIDGQQAVALLRDLSEHGAGFEADLTLRAGQKISYRWGDELPRTGTVIWSDGSFFGIENDEAANQVRRSDRYRAVRIPICAPATIFSENSRFDGEVLNIAQRGLCLLTSTGLREGALATIQIGRRVFENATAKWIDSERVGFGFSKPLSVAHTAAIMEGR